MKRLLLMLAALGLIAVGVGVFEWDRIHNRPHRVLSSLETERDFAAQRKMHCLRPDSVVLIGNSILHALRDSIERPGFAVWSVPGEFAVNLDQWTPCAFHPDIHSVYVLLGVNDLLAGFSADTVNSARWRFIGSLMDHGKEVYVMPIFPTELSWSPNVRPAHLRKERLRVNYFPRTAADRLEVWEAHTFDPKIWTDFTTDGVHPNEKGRRLMLEVLRDRFEIDRNLYLHSHE